MRYLLAAAQTAEQTAELVLPVLLDGETGRCWLFGLQGGSL
jgi:hypothetical protein